MPTLHRCTPSEVPIHLLDKPAAMRANDLEGIIVRATQGDRHARKLLRPVVRHIARSCAVYVDEVDRITASVLDNLPRSGRPEPGRATLWLENVVRTHAKEDFFERWFEDELEEEEQEAPPDE